MRYIFGFLLIIGGGFMGLVTVIGADSPGYFLMPTVFFFLGLYLVFKGKKRR